MTPSVPPPSAYPLALWPAAASSSAAQVDHLILGFTAVTLVLTLPIFLVFTYYAIRYREGRAVRRHTREGRSALIEISWMGIPFALTLIFFAWGARLFDTHKHPPGDAMRITAIGRQWMWKFQHPGGQMEINDLHLPVGAPIVVQMISQDVIHSLYIPALRIQMETLPDRYTELWFEANRPGTYRLYCSEYCGTDHSKMDGLLTLMRPADYAAWLARPGSFIAPAAQGRQLFTQLGCAGCHESPAAPRLAGQFGGPVSLASGGTAIFDDDFLRDKLLNPDRRHVAGFAPAMPSFRGVVSELQIAALSAYLRTLPDPSGVAP